MSVFCAFKKLKPKPRAAMHRQSARDMASSSVSHQRIRPQLRIQIPPPPPPPPHLQKPMPPIPPQTIRIVPPTRANNKEPRAKNTHSNVPKNPRDIIDIDNLTSNERIKVALEPLLARWSTNLSFREVTAIARLPAEEAEAMFVVELINSLEAEKRRRRAAESCVKMLEETHTGLLREKKEVHEEMQGLRRRSTEMREEEEWVCMRERDLRDENAALKEMVIRLEIDLRNARKRDGSMI
ncbi:hypothetical protein DFP73DRAFT_176024 [Morchella snyderi]|nr:hypothetical protein DFP73DRAFT_176024 [Morchella snyderi]